MKSIFTHIGGFFHMTKDWKKDVFTIPNMLSLFRLVLIPVYAAIYLQAKNETDYFIAAGILAVSCLTDMIDGKIARHFNMISTTGKILDPIADKATQFTMTVCLAVKYPILWTLLGLFVVKESFQLIAGLVTLHKGKMLNGALMSGKISTTFFFVSLILLVLIPEIDPFYLRLITGIDFAALLVAFIDYARVYVTRSSKIEEIPQKAKNNN